MHKGKQQQHSFATNASCMPGITKSESRRNTLSWIIAYITNIQTSITPMDTNILLSHVPNVWIDCISYSAFIFVIYSRSLCECLLDMAKLFMTSEFTAKKTITGYSFCIVSCKGHVCISTRSVNPTSS